MLFFVVKRIPYDQNTVYDNLVEVSRVNYAQFGKSTISTTAKLSFKIQDILLDLANQKVFVPLVNLVYPISMGSFEKYMARSFFFWMTRFLRSKYENVEIVFIAHHTEAKEVSEEEFFTKGESGGTICSSAYQAALDIINDRYPPAQFNIYPFHFSDGDNLTSDNERCVKLIGELIQRCNLFGYGEVNQYNRSSTLMSAYRNIHNPKFLHYVIREKGEVYKALKTFFTQSKEGAAL